LTKAVDYPNWFKLYADQYFTKHLTPFAGKPDLRFLQIGAYTGDATVWLLDNILTGDGSVLVDVDTWRGSDEEIHGTFDWADVERLYAERTAGARLGLRLHKHRCTSAEYLTGYCGPPFDFIYVDGAHDAYTVLNDGVSAFRVLKPGGLLAFDDYEWHSGKGDPHDPGIAIDAIGACYQGRLELIDLGAQAWFRRVA